MTDYFKKMANLKKALRRSKNIEFQNMWIKQINRLKHKRHLYEKRCQEKSQMKLYQIDYINSYGEKEFVAITDDPNEWLKDNNKQRIADGEKPEKITDFEIHLLFYTLDKKKRKTYKIKTRSEIKTHIYNKEKNQ